MVHVGLCGQFTVQLSASTSELRAGRRNVTNRGFARSLGAVILLVAAFLAAIASDAALALAVGTGVRLAGVWPTFAILTPLVTAIGFLLAMVVARAYRRSRQGGETRLADWVERQTKTRRGTLSRRLLDGAGIVGFVLASLVAGAIVTTFLSCCVGRTANPQRVALLSSLIFAVFYVGLYAGIFARVFR